MDFVQKIKSQHYNSKSVGEPVVEISTDQSNTNPTPTTATSGQTLIFAISQGLKYLLLFVIIAMFIIMLPIIPFLWVSYKGFHGKYGIIKLFRDNYNVYQL